MPSTVRNTNPRVHLASSLDHRLLNCSPLLKIYPAIFPERNNLTPSNAPKREIFSSLVLLLAAPSRTLPLPQRAVYGSCHCQRVLHCMSMERSTTTYLTDATLSWDLLLIAHLGPIRNLVAARKQAAHKRNEQVIDTAALFHLVRLLRLAFPVASPRVLPT